MNSSLTSHQLLEKLAFQEVTTASFPTHFAVIIRLRTAMNDRQAPHKKIMTMLNGEPVISARILQAANMASLHGHEPVLDLGTAVMMLGVSTVRRIALGVAMTQLAKTKELLVFANLSRSLWLHSLETAMASSVFAEELTTFNHDEAFFAGLMVNIGAFYLLYQAAHHPMLQRSPDDVHAGIKKFHASTTKKVLSHLKLPEAIITAADMTGFEPITMENPPKSLQEVVRSACVLAMGDHPWFESFTEGSVIGPMYEELHPKVLKGLEHLQTEFQQ